MIDQVKLGKSFHDPLKDFELIGNIVLTPQGGGQVLRVPYAGFVGDNPSTAWNDGDAYATCMDEAAVEKKGSLPNSEALASRNSVSLAQSRAATQAMYDFAREKLEL